MRYCKCGCGKKVSGFNYKLHRIVEYIRGHNPMDYSKFPRGVNHGLYKGGWVGKNGYRYILIYENNRRKQRLEHRYLIEQNIGRKLRKDEHIDHINGIKTDNRLENLRICTKRQNEHYYYKITPEDERFVLAKLLRGKTLRESIRGTNIKSIATALRIGKEAGIR